MQVDASLQNQNLRTDLRWAAKLIRKSPRKFTQIAKSRKFRAYTVDLRSICVDLRWVAKRWKTCVDLRTNFSLTKVDTSGWPNEMGASSTMSKTCVDLWTVIGSQSHVMRTPRFLCSHCLQKGSKSAFNALGFSNMRFRLPFLFPLKRRRKKSFRFVHAVNQCAVFNSFVTELVQTAMLLTVRILYPSTAFQGFNTGSSILEAYNGCY